MCSEKMEALRLKIAKAGSLEDKVSTLIAGVSELSPKYSGEEWNESVACLTKALLTKSDNVKHTISDVPSNVGELRTSLDAEFNRVITTKWFVSSAEKAVSLGLKLFFQQSDDTTLARLLSLIPKD